MAVGVAIILPACLLLLSGVLLVYALRGRRVDDHALCRRCGFDVSGRPAGSTVCSECGADLTRRRAVRVGRREKRRRVLAVALPVLLLSGGWLGVSGWRTLRAVDWDRHKPLSWLLKDAEGRRAAARDAALRELARRATEKKLPADVEQSLVDKALAHQADRAAPWVSGWGFFIEAVRDAERVPQDKWERYVANAATFVLESVETELRLGEPMTVRLVRGPDRVGAARANLDYEVSGTVKIGWRNLRVRDPSDWQGGTVQVPPGRSSIPPGGLLGKGVIDLHESSLKDLPNGPQAMTVKVTVRRSRQVNNPFASLMVDMVTREPPPTEVEVRGTFKLVPSESAGGGNSPGGAGEARP